MTERLNRCWVMLTGAHAGVISSSLLLMGGALWSGCSQAPHEQVHPAQAGTAASAPSSRTGNESAGNYSDSDDDSESDESTETDTDTENPVDSQVDPVNRAASSGT